MRLGQKTPMAPAACLGFLWAKSLGHVHRAVLRGPIAWFAQFYRDHAGPEGQRHDADAHADLHLGVVHHFLHRTPRIRRSAAGLPVASIGSHGGNEFLHSVWTRGQRPIAKPRGWFPTPLAAFVLVFWAP